MAGELNKVTKDGAHAICYICQEPHPIEYFQGVRGVALRYRCPAAMDRLIYVDQVPSLDLPVKWVYSRAYLKQCNEKKQLQLILMNHDTETRQG